MLTLLYIRFDIRQEIYDTMINDSTDMDITSNKSKSQNQTDNLNYGILNQLSNEYGDAFYLLNSNRFEQNYLHLKTAFSSIYPHFNIAYSYKTNYIPKLCKIVNKLNGYAEIVSDMELEIALRCGVETKHIIWNGPVKKPDKVEMLLLKGGTVNLDSIYEMKMIQDILKKYPGFKLNIGIRCNFDIGDGRISRFGYEIGSSEFYMLLDFIKQHKDLILKNLQCHFSERNVDYWPARAKEMIRVVEIVKDWLGYAPERVDLGGGIFGKMPDELKKQFNSFIPDYETYAECIRCFSEHFSDCKVELLIEPGSALAGDCMKFVCRVKSMNTVRNKTFITVLGSQKNINMSGINPPIEIYQSVNSHNDVENADIVGYTCIESDILYQNYSGKIGIDDFIVLSNCGSYSIVMKPPFIMENFPVIDICGKHTELIKRQEYFDDLFCTYGF